MCDLLSYLKNIESPTDVSRKRPVEQAAKMEAARAASLAETHFGD
jgi:outer membrane murein-binding lipoprotein Lpp